MDLTKVLDLIKLPARYLCAIALIGGAVLYLPPNTLERLGITKLANVYRAWFGIAFLASIGLLFVTMATSVIARLNETRWRRKMEASVKDRLLNLNELEKQILRYYFFKGTRSNRLRIDDGTVKGLVTSGVIYRSTNIGNVITGFDHNISQTALEFISQHPEVLDGSTNHYRCDGEGSGW